MGKNGKTGMKKLGEEIRTGQLKQAYLLCGEEAYLRRQYRDKVKKALMGDGDLMNLNCFEGKGIVSEEVVDLAQTMPFLAERRVLVIENSGFFKRGGEALAAYLANPAPTAFFVFVETEVDKRSQERKEGKQPVQSPSELRVQRQRPDHRDHGRERRTH